jgi:lantibiotic modifying enzyme
MDWTPLFAGSDARRAIEIARDIVGDLSSGGHESCAHELALLHAYWAEAFDDAAAWERADAFLDGAVERLARTRLSPSLFGGICGVAWTVGHLGGAADGDSADDEVALAVLDLVHRYPRQADVDLFRGLAGIGVYALARGSRASARATCAGVVARLQETAEHDAAGYRWLTPRERLHPGYHEQSPNGHYDLGMAHGLPGILAVLARMLVAGIDVERTRPLLDGAVRWLCAQALDDSPSTFSSFVVPQRTPLPARTAWCYGDPGVAIGLLSAAHALGSDEHRRRAIAIARKAAGRVVDAGVVDAGLCHGAAGLGHSFHRLHRATGDETLRDAALYWFRQCMEMHQRGMGIGGFRAYGPDAHGVPSWYADPTLASGSAGIALALLAAATGVEPGWDELLLMRVVDER